MPDEALSRVAVLTDGTPPPPEFDARMVGEPAGSQVAYWFNQRPIQQAAIPGSGGIMNARSLARCTAFVALAVVGLTSGCRRSAPAGYQGYLEGEYVYLASPLAGSTTDNYSAGTTLSDSGVQAVVSSAIASGRLPKDTGAV